MCMTEQQNRELIFTPKSALRRAEMTQNLVNRQHGGNKNRDLS